MSVRGKIHAVGSKQKMKTEKIADVSRDFIAIMRTCFASGDQSTCLFLAKGKKLGKRKFKDLSSYFKAPEGSEMGTTLNALMTDDS